MFEMSQILNCGIDQKTLSILASLVENGVNPEALAAVVKELKRESDALKVSVQTF
jgi:mitotic-spindle organizing protein 1